MRLNKFSIGLGAALLGTIAAFATKQKAAPGPYFYISAGGTSCQPYTPIFSECEPGGLNCLALANAPIPGAQLYLRTRTNITNPMPCSISLKLENGF